MLSKYIFCSFVFTSRRRHTRWPRDWSSDVCSSDLLLAPLASHDGVVEIRRLGTMTGVEVRSTGERTGAVVCRAARRLGVWLRPLGDTVVLMPPLALGPSETDLLVGALALALDEVFG